ncbi:AraC family transcriptional regulator [Oxalobacteraceae bacterium A2-2]
MAIRIVQHTQFHWDAEIPTDARPVTMRSRDLATGAVKLPHRHPWGQLTYAMEGMLRLTADRSSWILPPQRAIWVAPDVVHEVTVLEATRLRPLCVHPSRVPFPGSECRVLEVSGLLRELIAALEQLDDGEQSARRALLSGLILDELPRCQTRPLRVPLPADKRLKALCVALMADPGAELSLRDWSQQVGASERTLARLFERELGMGFVQWRQQVRLAHAAPMIARGTPLSQVAHALGYASQSAFSAMFKKTFGCSPSAFFA